MDQDLLKTVKLTGKALASGWLEGFEERKRKAVHDLFDIVENSEDNELRVEAFKALVRAGDADAKRELIALKKQAMDEDRKLRLLELVKSLPDGVIARLAAGNEGTADSGRADTSAGPNGETQGVRT